MTYTVEVSGLCKAFGTKVVLEDVNLRVGTGTVQALLGPNGAGKTTMVRILSTLITPDAGGATIAGHDLLSDPVGVKRSISLTGQFAAVDTVLTGRENLEMMARLLRVPRRKLDATVTALLERFGLGEAADRRVGTYSGGMQRRLDLAIGMIARPALVFLDEPTTGLDPRSREQVWGTIRALVEQDVTVLLTTQYLEEADQLADTVAVLDQGRIVANGRAEDLKAELGGGVVRLQFPDLQSLRQASAALGPSLVDERLCALEIPSDGTAAGLSDVLARLDKVSAARAKVSIHRPSLDDVFLSLTSPETGSAPTPATSTDTERLAS